MASKTTVTIVDDINGTEGAATVRFAFEGTDYEIDLADANTAKLREALDPFLANARKVGKAASRSSKTNSAGKPDLTAVREWAQANGHKVAARGRIPASVTEAYEAAH